MKISDTKSRYRPIRISGNAFFAILAFIAIFGVLIGSVFYRELSAIEFVENFSLADSFISENISKTFFQYFSEILLKYGFLLAICFISGLCVIGQPICVGILFYRGICAGTSISLIYSTYGVKGFLLSLLAVVPEVVVSTFSLILSAREGIRFSNKLFKTVFLNRTDDDMIKNIKLYLLKFVVLFGIIIVLSLIESVFMILVMKT